MASVVVPRSHSVNAIPSPLQFQANKIALPRDDGINRRVHLIPSDLWEAITGEHATPQTICEICNVSLPTGHGN